MTSFLKRLTVKLDGTSGGSHGPTSMMVEDDRAPPRSPLASSVSFNDFSMHVMMDGDHHMYDEGSMHTSHDDGFHSIDGFHGGAASDPLPVPAAGETGHSNSNIMSHYDVSKVSNNISMGFSLPQGSYSHGGHPAMSSGMAASAPATPTGVHHQGCDAAASAPTMVPKGLTLARASFLGTPKKTNGGEQTPRSSLDLPNASSISTPRASLCEEGDGMPASPKSPRTPGGKRKKGNKIHGLDYYEFCELVRAGSL